LSICEQREREEQQSDGLEVAEACPAASAALGRRALRLGAELSNAEFERRYLSGATKSYRIDPSLGIPADSSWLRRFVHRTKPVRLPPWPPEASEVLSVRAQ
jgi:hypothetical protein